MSDQQSVDWNQWEGENGIHSLSSRFVNSGLGEITKNQVGCRVGNIEARLIFT